MKDTMGQKPGNAPIIRTGHTTDGRYGSDPNAMVKGKTESRDIRR